MTLLKISANYVLFDSLLKLKHIFLNISFFHHFYLTFQLMISYSNPLCPITQKSATMFCFTESCNKPAFACKKSELSSHKHGLGGRCYFWEEILPAIQTIMEKGLLPDDINAL
jgi:hypothetical protein